MNDKNAKKIELFGLFFLLIATFWQIFLVNPFNENYTESHNLIVRENSYDILRSQIDLADMIVSENIEVKLKTRDAITERNFDRITNTIKARDKREKTWSESAEKFKSIRILLFGIGSILLMLSKFVELKTIKQNTQREKMRNNKSKIKDTNTVINTDNH